MPFLLVCGECGEELEEHLRRRRGDVEEVRQRHAQSRRRKTVVHHPLLRYACVRAEGEEEEKVENDDDTQ